MKYATSIYCTTWDIQPVFYNYKCTCACRLFEEEHSPSEKMMWSLHSSELQEHMKKVSPDPFLSFMIHFEEAASSRTNPW